MLGLPKYSVTIFTIEVTPKTPTVAEIRTENTLIDHEMLSIERIPNSKVFNITGIQQNEKATYILYLKAIHPEIPQQANVVWEMHNKTYTGKVKFSQPMAKKLLGFNRECYIQSDNQ